MKRLALVLVMLLAVLVTAATADIRCRVSVQSTGTFQNWSDGGYYFETYPGCSAGAPSSRGFGSHPPGAGCASRKRAPEPRARRGTTRPMPWPAPLIGGTWSERVTGEGVLFVTTLREHAGMGVEPTIGPWPAAPRVRTNLQRGASG